MKFKSIVLAGILSVTSALSAAATTYSFGDVTGGATITNTLSVQTVDFIEFSLDAPPGFKLSALTISVTSVAGSNFRESIGLYSNGALVRAASAVGNGGNAATMTFSGPAVLAEGAYTLGIAGWRAFFTPDIANVRSTAYFKNGMYTVRIDPTISAVPLPAGGLLVMSGFGALALASRRTRKA